MDQATPPGLGNAAHPVPDPRHGPLRRLLRDAIHFFSYHLVMRRQDTWRTRAAGIHLVAAPTVFHPPHFITSERFADFVGGLAVDGQPVVDIGTGTGSLAIAAARAGAERVIAPDINPNAALSVPETARRNGAGDRVTAVCMNL